MNLTTSSNYHIFGVRHHGPGSAYSLRQALQALEPDLVLVEGPADATYMLPWLSHADLEPPVALILYRPDEPKRATTFPFSIFSPELQAIRHAFEQGLPVRFMDLPQSYLLAGEHKIGMPNADPLTQLAQAAGYKSYEVWWNVLIEQRQNDKALFEGILLMMQAARQAADQQTQPTAQGQPARTVADRREAHMRQCIRTARQEGYRRIGVVCGAWHGPALCDLGDEATDVALLSDLPAVTVEAAWVPWTYSRLSFTTGYGAGIASPGWYHHLWEAKQAQASPSEASTHWLTKVATLLRAEGFDVSSAHIIEAVRLAEALAAMRDFSAPGLAELNEATQTVMCFGDPAPMTMIQKKLTISERMGQVPPDSPMVPLQRNLHQLQKRLRLRPEPEKSVLNLDLRNEMHLERSHLLHRLNLLDIGWGTPMSVRGKKGTYREVWRLEWRPDFAIRVIEASVWGNSVVDAAAASAEDTADKAGTLPALTQLLDRVILADLPDTIAHVMQRIEETAALSRDILHMMEALPPLAHVLRYGSVRNTDKAVVQQVVDGLVKRICIGLPATCAALDDQAAADMFDRLSAVDEVINTLEEATYTGLWQAVLLKLADQKNIHGLLAGRACRLLLDGRVFSAPDTAPRLERALSTPTIAGRSLEQLLQAAAWIEGFLRGSDLLLVHDQTLWHLLDSWINLLGEEQFLNVLPLLRRTFTSFSEAVRQQLSERVRFGQGRQASTTRPRFEFDQAQAEAVLPLVARLLSIDNSRN